MWPRPSVTERRDPDGHQTRVGYILRRCGFERHCGIVSRICLLRGGRRGEAATVLTASRDGTLKCWDVPANETHGGATSSTAPPPGSSGQSSGVQLRCSLEEHTGWVNDCVVLPQSSSSADASRDSRRLVSASNDNLVKVWQVDEEKPGAGVAGAFMSLRYHVDYVTCLAYAPHRALLASAGLDARVVISDLEAATRFISVQAGDGEPYGGTAGGHRSGVGAGSSLRGAPNGTAAAAAAQQRCTVGQFSGNGQYIPQLLGSQERSRDGAGHGEHGRNGGWEEGGSGSGTASSGGASVWSLAMTRNASLLACGTASCVVRGWDPRSGTRLWRLRGHTENVRALVLSEDGTICVSGSADRTVRVWDIGTRRCMHVFDAHHDSVWALAVAGYSCGYASSSGGGDAAGAGGSLTKVFSGGRDGLLLAHDLRQMQTGLVVREPSPLQAIAVPADAHDIWASAADSHVRRHSVPSSLVPFSAVTPSQADAASVPPPGATPLSPVPALPPAAADDCIVVSGTPRLTDYKVLDNKRQVIVRDACDQLALWDVTSGQCVDFPFPTPSSPKEPGPSRAEDIMKRAFAMVNRPVSVPNWFTCDLSLGSLSIYLDVAQCFKAEPDEPDSFITPGGTSTRNSSARGQALPQLSPALAQQNLGTRTLRALFESWPPGMPSDHTSLTAEPMAGSSSSLAFPPATALVLVSRSGRRVGHRGRLYCGLFNGSESPELLPPWAVDVVWNQRPPPEELCGERILMFTLARYPDELALPGMPTSYCVATPRTRIRRLMSYLVRTLDFDWSTPAKITARRPASAAGSLVSRLGRCCVVPAARGRPGSADSWGSQSEGGDQPVGAPPRSGGQRLRGSSRERGGFVNGHHHSSGQGTSSGRRSFGLRRGEDDGSGPGNSVVGRVRIDGSPAPLPSVPAGNHGGVGRSLKAPPEGGMVGTGADEPPLGVDERWVEVLCNDMPMDPEMSLATVRDFIWKKPSLELTLHFRRAARATLPTSPPPTPPLLPGAATGATLPLSSSNDGLISQVDDARGSSTAPKE